MSPLKKYKPWFAAFLLALYTFIALPVHLWHSHAQHPVVGANAKVASLVDMPGSVSKAVVETKGCTICDHQYPPYLDNAVQCFVPAIILVMGRYYLHAERVSVTDYFFFSNKGPPSALHFSA